VFKVLTSIGGTLSHYTALCMWLSYMSATTLYIHPSHPSNMYVVILGLIIPILVCGFSPFSVPIMYILRYTVAEAGDGHAVRCLQLCLTWESAETAGNSVPCVLYTSIMHC
jgi:hypothetical protein